LLPSPSSLGFYTVTGVYMRRNTRNSDRTKNRRLRRCRSAQPNNIFPRRIRPERKNSDTRRIGLRTKSLTFCIYCILYHRIYYALRREKTRPEIGTVPSNRGRYFIPQTRSMRSVKNSILSIPFHHLQWAVNLASLMRIEDNIIKLCYRKIVEYRQYSMCDLFMKIRCVFRKKSYGQWRL